MKKISDCQHFPNFSIKFPNFAQLFSDENSKSRLIAISTEADTCRFYLIAILPVMGFHIISVWTGTGISDKSDNPYTIRTHSIGHSHSNILITSSDAQTCMARYVLRHTKLDLCLKTLASFSVGLTPKSSSPLSTIKLFPLWVPSFVSFTYDPMTAKITSFAPEQAF